MLNPGTDNGKRYAAIALGWLAYDKVTRHLIVAAKAIPPLVDLLSSGTDNGKVAGAFALGWLANEVEARGQVVSSGAIDPLVKLVASETGDGRTTAAGALGWLANEQPGRGMIVAAGAIEALVQLLRTGDDRGRQYAANALGWVAHDRTGRGGMAVAGAIAPFAQFAMSVDGKATHSTPVVTEAVNLLTVEHPELMSQVKALISPASREAKSAGDCIPGEWYAAAGSSAAGHAAGACVECKPGFADHDGNPRTGCVRCTQIPERFEITGFAGSCAMLEEAQTRRDFYLQWWQKWTWTVYATLSLVGIGVPLGFIFERETRAESEHED